MGSSFRLGRIAGIEVNLHPTFFLLFLYLVVFQGGITSGLLASAVFGCVLLHELGHALAARWFGIGTKHITLYPIGGVAQLERMPRAPGAELVISLAGPAVNLLLAFALGGILWLAGSFESAAVTSPLTDVLVRLLQANVVLFLFNLVPAFPMDGGRVLRASLAGWIGRRRATELAAGLGQALAVAFPLYMLLSGSLSIVHLFLAGFVFFAARAELNHVRLTKGLDPTHGRPRSEGVWVAPPGYRWVSRGTGLWQLVPITVDSYGTR